jgi:plastocyanin
MRRRFVFAALGLGALAVVSATPGPADACHQRGRGSGYGYGAPPPMYYQPGPPMYRPGPMYLAPGAYPMAPAPPVAGPMTTVSVSVEDNQFKPAMLNIQPGTTVRFGNYGKTTHTVTATNGEWDSGDLSPGSAYTATFIKPGTYKYYCRHHKGMEGTIVVGEPGKVPVEGPGEKGKGKGPAY